MMRLIMCLCLCWSIAAEHIGAAYHNGDVNPLLHKLLHGAVGGASGFVMKGKDGALSGASSAVVAETLADMIAPHVKDGLIQIAITTGTDHSAYHTQVQDYLTHQHNLILLTSVAITASLGGDVDQATVAADNALSHNAMRAFVKLAKKLAQKTGPCVVKKAVKEGVKKASKEGIKKPAKDMADREFVQNIANRADKINPGNGPRVGTQKHTYAKKLGKRYQKMTGEKGNLKFEELYKGNKPYDTNPTGVKNSTRPDVYNQKTGEVFDYKFGNAKLGPRQIQKLQDQMPVNPDGSRVIVTEIKPN